MPDPVQFPKEITRDTHQKASAPLTAGLRMSTEVARTINPILCRVCIKMALMVILTGSVNQRSTDRQSLARNSACRSSKTGKTSSFNHRQAQNRPKLCLSGHTIDQVLCWASLQEWLLQDFWNLRNVIHITLSNLLLWCGSRLYIQG